MEKLTSTTLIRLKFALSGAFILGILFSTKLWLSQRLYPLTPFFHIFGPFPYPFDRIILIILCGLLICIALSKRPIFIFLSVALCSILFLQDQSRLYPSFYEYFILLILLGTYFNNPTEKQGRRIYMLCQFIIVAIYIWSGVSKLNPYFVQSVLPWLIEPLHLPLYPLLPKFFGYIAALSEIVFGIALLIPRFRKIALYELLIMHGFLLFLIGPFRGNWNDAAWSWNIASGAFLFILFSNTSTFSFKELFRRFSKITMAILILIGILPGLNLVNLWDSALSFNVYSGNTNTATIRMNEVGYENLNREAKTAGYIQNDNSYIIYLDLWNSHQFNAGAYPELRIFKRVFRQVCEETKQNSSVMLVVIKKAQVFEWQRIEEIYLCNSIDL